MSNYYIRNIEADGKHPATTCIYMPLSDGGWVVFEPTTDSHYAKEYLAWVAEGNEATEWTGN
jgi:hypothetical protein